jgi:hypothetical protein
MSEGIRMSELLKFMFDDDDNISGANSLVRSNTKSSI